MKLFTRPFFYVRHRLRRTHIQCRALKPPASTRARERALRTVSAGAPIVRTAALVAIESVARLILWPSVDTQNRQLIDS